MKDVIYKIIMRNPIPSIITVISLFVPYSLAILFFDYTPITRFGWAGIISFSVIFHSFIVATWWFVSYLVKTILLQLENKRLENSNTTIYHTKEKDWLLSVSVGSFFSLMIGFLSLVIVELTNRSFKSFLIITIAIPIIRLFLVLLEYLYIRLRNKI